MGYAKQIDIDKAVNRHLDRVMTPLHKRIGQQARRVQRKAEVLLLADEPLSWGARCELIGCVKAAERALWGIGTLQAMDTGEAWGLLFKALEIEKEG